MTDNKIYEQSVTILELTEGIKIREAKIAKLEKMLGKLCEMIIKKAGCPMSASVIRYENKCDKCTLTGHACWIEWLEK